MRELVGRVLLNRYRVEAFVGRGGMAEVYRALDLRRSVQVALKVLNEDLAEDFVFLRRFAREARTLELLQHPHIVRFLGFEESGALAFLVMEYIEGLTLRRYLKLLRRPLTLPEALYIARPVCAALHYAHQKGVYHRDVKPGNIFIEQTGRVVLGDFGIAKLSESSTVTFSTPGTPAYMSPEQCRDEQLDARTDIYSLGITLYETLTLDRPFKGDAGRTTGSRRERVRWEQMHVPPRPPSSVNPRVAAATERALLRALEKDPGQRQHDPMELYQDLSQKGSVRPASRLPAVEGQVWAQRSRQQYAAPSRGSDRSQRVGSAGGMLSARATGVLVGGIGVTLLAVLMLALIGMPTVGHQGEVPTSIPQLSPDASTVTGSSLTVVPKNTPYPSPTPTSPPASTSTSSQTPSVAATSPWTPSPTRSPALRVVFVVGPVGNTDIGVMDEDEADWTLVADDYCDEAEPTWSPDGRLIAYQADCGGSYDIWTVGAAGGRPTRLTPTGSIDEREPDWSPDGAKIIYRSNTVGSNRNSDGELWVMDADGGGRQPLGGGGILGRSPVWSPDEEYVLFMSERSGRWQIYVYAMDTGATSQVTQCGTNCRWPCWSPDGRHIAYHSTVSARGATSAVADTIWVLATGGGEPTALASGYHAGRPSWSRSGEIVFNSNRGIEVIDANDHCRRVLISGDEHWAPEVRW